MLTFDNGGLMVEHLNELPNLVGAKDVFLDLETSSGHPKLTSLNPWQNCFIAGIAITVDNAKNSWYIPVGHATGMNLPIDPVLDWVCDIFNQCDRWINHNVKYDCQVLYAAGGLKVECPLVDTVTLAKIIDSDRVFKGGYGLDALSKYWLHEDISKYEAAMKPYLAKNKDYGRVPADVMAPYACQDTLTERRLWHYIDARCPEECRDVWNTEIEMTSVLVDIEQWGMRVDCSMLKQREFVLLHKLHQLDEKLTKLVGYSFRPHTNADCYDVLCNKYGLPVMKWTDDSDDGNPSFDKEALSHYLGLPDTPREVVEAILEYRKLHTHLGLFVTKFQELQVDGILHPSYTQTVRTGRLSCKQPNSQQLDLLAKELILPREGFAFLSDDYSQIEFRTIVHYINDSAAIKAYNEDPDTDFHQWLADEISIKRRPAKTVNFMVAFGGGKAKTQQVLSVNPDIVADLHQHIDELIEKGRIKASERTKIFKAMAKAKAEEVYNNYHAALPGIKLTSRKASLVATQRGYVRNLAGRRRHLPASHAHLAFNTLNQSTAADIMKERVVALWHALKGTPLRINALVHDEVLLEGPQAAIEDKRTWDDITALLEAPRVKLRVPLRTAFGISSESWAAASEDKRSVTPVKHFTDFAHLK